jgi:hypothetical protein
VRPFMRWHVAAAVLPSTAVVASVTALAIVGSLLLEEGANASAQQQTNRPAAHRTAVYPPAEPIVIPVVDGPVVPVVRSGLARSSSMSLGELPGPFDPDVALADRAHLTEFTAQLAVVGGTRDTSVQQASAAATRAERRRHRRRVRWNNAPVVTWYGPGFYGNRTACGVRYGRYMRGVAHRSLPCGTMVKLRWHGLTTRVPVVDRGPYSGRHIVFDLTAAVSCRDLKPRRVHNACFTRKNVRWRVVGKVKLSAYFRAKRR